MPSYETDAATLDEVGVTGCGWMPLSRVSHVSPVIASQSLAVLARQVHVSRYLLRYGDIWIPFNHLIRI